jgi:hypothetical protein
MGEMITIKHRLGSFWPLLGDDLVGPDLLHALSHPLDRPRGNSYRTSILPSAIAAKFCLSCSVSPFATIPSGWGNRAEFHLLYPIIERNQLAALVRNPYDSLTHARDLRRPFQQRANGVIVC